ncbi:MAG: HAD-IA family hydrolase [Paludibacteraceae bacterium]|nr:HAD-IA family hydrolase [Paludibacteraceae bacterium]
MMKLFRPIENLPLEDYLQMEAEMVKTIEEPTFFTWVVAPTVIYGRHQNREQEVNEAYCAAHGVRIVQRQSGGGCVYADRGNLMVSYISPSTHSQEVFDEFLHLLAGALNALGYKAVTTVHNDVLVGGRKVSGTACYTTPTGTVVHASMLYDVDMDALQQAITPSAAKLAKHAVQSVRQRVSNLREISDLGDIESFRQILEKEFMQHISPVSEQAVECPLVIFDLDGTLLNTIDDLGYACNHALAAEGFPTHAIEEYPRLVGNGVNKLIERALPAELKTSSEATETLVQRVRAHFVPYYDAHNCDYTRPYEGIPELLAELKSRGWHLAVASNKYQAATEKIVAHFFPGMFDVVLGERVGVPRKPDPRIVQDILSTFSFQLSPFTLYIGDSLVDCDTAANAGLPFVACSWGFVPREKLAEAGCRQIIDTPAELLNIIQ